MIEKQFLTDSWVVIHDGVKVFFAGDITAGQFLATGKPLLEEFQTKEELNVRLKELSAELV